MNNLKNNINNVLTFHNSLPRLIENDADDHEEDKEVEELAI